MARCSVYHMEFWSSGYKSMSLGQTDKSGVRRYADQGPGGLGGRDGAQTFQKQGLWIMGTETTALKYGICC